MAAIEFSEVELFNLTLLLTIRDSVGRDPALACGQFGLREDDAMHLAALTPTQILAIVTNVGSQALFSLRPDLFEVMRAPLPLAATLFAVHPPTVVHPLVSTPGRRL